MTVHFTLEDAHWVSDKLGANCGPAVTSLLHQTLLPEHQLDLVSRCGDIGGLARFCRLEQQLPGVHQGHAMRDADETLEDQVARVTQCLKALAGLEHQRSAQCFVPVHAANVAHCNLRMQDQEETGLLKC